MPRTNTTGWSCNFKPWSVGFCCVLTSKWETLVLLSCYYIKVVCQLIYFYPMLVLKTGSYNLLYFSNRMFVMWSVFTNNRPSYMFAFPQLIDLVFLLCFIRFVLSKVYVKTIINVLDLTQCDCEYMKPWYSAKISFKSIPKNFEVEETS